jgi:hypothetical protein
MHPMLTAWGGGVYTTTKKSGGRALVLAAMVATMALAGTVLFAAQAWAGSFYDSPPEAVLMKYKTVLQAQGNDRGTWYYYEGSGWSFTIYDIYGDYAFPDPQTVGAGRRLHIRFDKPERPSAVAINAYPRVGKHGYPSGQRRQLQRTLRPVKKVGETVGWDVFFRVNRPERHYYMNVDAAWERVPGKRISYGEYIEYGLHVRTR